MNDFDRIIEERQRQNGIDVCECKLLVSNALKRDFVVPRSKYRFVHYGKPDIPGFDGFENVLIDEFWCEGKINFAAVHEITNCHGVKQGYMFIVGERSDD